MALASVFVLGAMSPGPSLAVVLRNTIAGGRSQGVATGIGHAGFYYLLTKYDVSKITPLTLLAPVLGIINALIISYFALIDGFSEIISYKIIFGGLLTLLGVAIVMIREKNTKVPESP